MGNFDPHVYRGSCSTRAGVLANKILFDLGKCLFRPLAFGVKQSEESNKLAVAPEGVASSGVSPLRQLALDKIECPPMSVTQQKGKLPRSA